MALQRWFPFLSREPHAIVAGCGWFLVCCLPIVTIGPAWTALTYYINRRERGVLVSWKEACLLAFRQKNAWSMWLSDSLAMLMAGGCLLAMLESPFSIGFRFVYALFFLVDVLYLLSGIYRYPALTKEPSQKTSLLMLRGFLMFIGSLGWSLMFVCVQLLLFMVCAITGIGLLLIYPAAFSALSACAYEEMSKFYIQEENSK